MILIWGVLDYWTPPYLVSLAEDVRLHSQYHPPSNTTAAKWIEVR
jgi:hypothetical protein